MAQISEDGQAGRQPHTRVHAKQQPTEEEGLLGAPAKECADLGFTLAPPQVRRLERVCVAKKNGGTTR